MKGMGNMDGMNGVAETIASMVDSATRSFATIYPMVTGKQVVVQQAPAPAYQQDATSKYLLYGGLAIGAIALFMAMKKRS